MMSSIGVFTKLEYLILNSFRSNPKWSSSIARHRRYLLQMGLMDRLAGERPLEMSVAETASGEETLERMVDVGRQLKEEDGAEALVMGCAGMARHRSPLEKALGIPVIDPTQAAVTMALGAVQFSRS
jgi:Asp/Glu/hydantoin racemase